MKQAHAKDYSDLGNATFSEVRALLSEWQRHFDSHFHSHLHSQRQNLEKTSINLNDALFNFKQTNHVYIILILKFYI